MNTILLLLLPFSAFYDCDRLIQRNNKEEKEVKADDEKRETKQ